MNPRPDYCVADADDLAFPIGPHRPCACGATVGGKDPARGICQARHNRPMRQPMVHIVLIDKKTGKAV